jgi:hypothetical protein
MMFFLHFLVQLVPPKPGRPNRQNIATSWGYDAKNDVEPFKYAIFSILYKYCLTAYLMTSYRNGTLRTVRHRHHRFFIPPHRAIHRPTHRQFVGKLNYYFIFKPESWLLNMYDSIFFVLQASQSSQSPSIQWGESPAGKIVKNML